VTDVPKTFAGRLTALASRNGRPLRFAAAGVVNTLFGLSIYPLLLSLSPTLHRHYLIGLAIAQATSLCFAFGTYKWAVFRTHANVFREFGKFCSFYVINYAANWLALPLLVEGAGVPPVVGQFGFSLVVMIGSYFWHSRLTFRPTGKSR